MTADHYDIGYPVNIPSDPILESLLDLYLLDTWRPENANGDLQLEAVLTDKGRAVFAAVPYVRKVRAFVKYGNYLYAKWNVANLALEELPEFLVHEVLMIRQAAGQRLKELCNA